MLLPQVKRKYTKYILEAFVIKNYQKFNFTQELAQNGQKLIEKLILNLNQPDNFKEVSYFQTDPQELQRVIKIQFETVCYNILPKLVLASQSRNEYIQAFEQLKQLQQYQISTYLSNEKQYILKCFEWYIQIKLNNIADFQTDCQDFKKHILGLCELELQHTLEKAIKVVEYSLEDLLQIRQYRRQQFLENYDLCREAFNEIWQFFRNSRERYIKDGGQLEIFNRNQLQ
ncbi:hypothetical protein PPERSA_04109 [Pseudocohnilembus persalinus]|uniref:Uncharacterized protein n=1 Tax=Pseudocohnilembus persalinus TaxID=266149 RepID=A0A0V0QNN0_PSEPJ|nr:hypothetical protein PPERSA_04109 [Pseudocohnilembus persalinus]|eukprot:KRX03557.1 hypothetical protein PPERSA_04109 [Pseudocohnilembus persalinus]